MEGTGSIGFRRPNLINTTALVPAIAHEDTETAIFRWDRRWFACLTSSHLSEFVTSSVSTKPPAQVAYPLRHWVEQRPKCVACVSECTYLFDAHIGTHQQGRVALCGEEFHMSKETIEAIILDLDGVITRTARIHAEAWKRMFDQYLARREQATEPQKPFDLEEDYRQYVDGKPRYDGVRSFMHSRGIELPEGTPEDESKTETICGLGNWKNDLFHELVEKEGAEVYEDTLEKIKEWRDKGWKTAVVSSSKNCGPILKSAGIEDLFDTKVDGLDSERLGLDGKPEPDIFLKAAEQLGVEPSRAVVVEDAVAGVQAGAAGKFAGVVGVNRDGDRVAVDLRAGGADVVVRDMRTLALPEMLRKGNQQ